MPLSTKSAHRAEQQAALAAVLLPVVSRALEAGRGSPELVAWVESESRAQSGGEADRGRVAAKRVANRLAQLVSECGFAGPLQEQIFLTIRAQKPPETRAE